MNDIPLVLSFVFFAGLGFFLVREVYNFVKECRHDSKPKNKLRKPKIKKTAEQKQEHYCTYHVNDAEDQNNIT